MCCVAALAVCAACASKPPEEKKPVSAPPPTAAVAAASVAPAPKAQIGAFGLDLSARDLSVRPGDDFFEYANGKWDKSFTIPEDKASFGPFDRLDELSKERVRHIIERSIAAHAAKGTPEQQIGDFYTAFMDEAAIEANGLTPAEPDLQRIGAAKSRADIARLFGSIGYATLFDVQLTPDNKNPDRYAAVISESSLGLPDRDYYLKDDPKMKAMREAYEAHVRTMLGLAGLTGADAAAQAKTVLRIERLLAEASLDKVARRDPKKVYHRLEAAGLQRLAPRFPWAAYFSELGLPSVSGLNVAVPGFFAGLNVDLEKVMLADWRAYLRWHAVHRAATALSKKFVDENFAFYGKTLTGAKELRPRWKRCVDLTDEQLGEALGQRYVEKTFGAEGKARMAKMVDALETALREDIKTLPWMTDTTKQQALVKLTAIANKIGYPDTWRDYTSVKIVRGDAMGNAERASQFEQARDNAKIGKPVDTKEWGMTPPTVNAYYSGSHNEIVFPAGILQPPFFDNTMDDAINMGGIGLVIGHELTHGFDDQGRKFDPKGNLRDWWTAQDGQEFEKRASCVADEYSSFIAVDDLHLNGRLTLGENTADNGGARIALMALHDLMAKAKQDPNKKTDGYTPDQRFFLGFGRVWCENITPELARLGVRTDPHSPGRWRVNGVVRNMPEFQKAFGCKTGQPMAPANACRVW
jgi:predicted metalloendopeptidase